jgi:uncharacterized protein YraI
MKNAKFLNGDPYNDRMIPAYMQTTHKPNTNATQVRRCLDAPSWQHIKCPKAVQAWGKARWSLIEIILNTIRLQHTSHEVNRKAVPTVHMRGQSQSHAQPTPYDSTIRKSRHRDALRRDLGTLQEQGFDIRCMTVTSGLESCWSLLQYSPKSAVPALSGFIPDRPAWPNDHRPRYAFKDKSVHDALDGDCAMHTHT